MQAYDNVGGFNHRRKRNLDLSGIRNKKSDFVTGIQWESAAGPNQDELESSWEEEEREAELHQNTVREAVKSQSIPPSPVTNNQTICLNGEPIRFQGTGNEKSFAETHVRFTSYLEQDLFEVVKALKKQGHIRSITDLVNESIKHYLTCNHS